MFTAALQFFYLHEIRDNPFFTRPVLDEAIHLEWAGRWANDEAWFPGEPFFRAPLYPLLLSGAMRLFGRDYVILRVLQMLLALATPVLVYALGRALHSRTAGAVAGILAACYGMILYFNASFLIVVLLLPLDLGALLLLLRARAHEDHEEREDRGERPLWFGAGLLLGLSAIARPNILLFAIAIGAWAGVRALRHRLAPYALGLLLPIVPVTLHNLSQGEFVPIAWQAGTNFYIGNNRAADGMTAIAPGTEGTWWGGYRDLIRIAEEAEGRTLARTEISSYWFGRGLDEIAADPAHAARLLLKKTWLLIADFEVSNNQGIYFFAQFSPLLSKLMLFGMGLLFPLAFLGVVVTRGSRARTLLLLFLAAYALSIVLFFVTARYRMPLVPVLLVFAACGLVAIVDWIRKRAYVPLAFTLVALAGLSALAHAPLLAVEKDRFAQGYYNIGTVLLQEGNAQEALTWFQKAIDEEPAYRNARYNLGLSYSLLGRHTEAEEALRALLAVSPGDTPAQRTLGSVYESMGRYDDAAREYAASLRTGAPEPEVLFSLGALRALRSVPRAGDNGITGRDGITGRNEIAGTDEIAGGFALLRARGREGEIAIWIERLVARGIEPALVDSLAGARPAR